MENIIAKAQNDVKHLLSEQLGKNYLFYNLSQTIQTVDKANELLDAQKNKSIDHQAIMLATWFLHSGFSESYIDHSKKSCELFKKFGSQNNLQETFIDKVCQYIQSAWSESKPNTEEEEIIKDIRTSFYASEDFTDYLQLLHMEEKNFGQNPGSLEAFQNVYLEKLRIAHRFYTDHAKENWQEQKEKNVFSLISSASKTLKTKSKEKLKVRLKNESPERAIQSMYRTQLRNHIKLSDIADTKANILLSVNAIIISLLLANLIPKLDAPSNSYLIYPTVIFVLFSIASMIMSVLATRPKIENKDMVSDDIKTKDMNILFFGNFHTLELQDFKSKIKDIIKDKESIYDSLTMDLYFLGKVLQKKYRLLRSTYTVFIVGVILSVIAFTIALKYYGMENEILDAVTPDKK